MWHTAAFAGGWMADGMWIWSLVSVLLACLLGATLYRLALS